MRSFNVLATSTNIHQHYLLEASAGTGKTFAIEHIVVRLLIETFCPIEKILVVTFTRAAASDLRQRIRTNLEKSIHFINCFLKQVGCEEIPEYLLDLCQIKDPKIIKRALEQALMNFDQAQILTIHAFCSRVLSENIFESDIGLEGSEDEVNLKNSDLSNAVKDFLRTALNETNFRIDEIRVILQEYGPSIEDLQISLLELIKKGYEIEKSLSLEENFQIFCEVMANMSKKYNTEKILNEFHALEPNYKGIRNIKKQIKPEILEKVENFSTLFGKECWTIEDYDYCVQDQLFLIKLFDKKNKGAKADLITSSIFEEVKNKLLPIISSHVLFGRMAYLCNNLIRTKFEYEEKYGFNELLKNMSKASINLQFSKKISSNYEAVLVDEFQDTDPLQWEIFQNLFLRKENEWKGKFYLIGDPKQSIYAFRQADIYTYLAAENALGQGSLFSLDTNYRSQPSLVSAMNKLFNQCREMIALPRLKTSLQYRSVNSSKKAVEKMFSDNYRSIHFSILKDSIASTYSLEEWEKKYFLPFIVSEIQKLNHLDNIKLSQFAVLVADRFQAERVSEFLKSWGIEFVCQRNESLASSLVLPALRELLHGIINPRHESSLKVALGGILIGQNHDQIKSLELDLDNYQRIISIFLEWQKIWKDEGFASFMSAFLLHKFEDNKSIQERLLIQKGGDQILNDFQQISDLLLDYENAFKTSPEKLIEYLDNFQELELNEEPVIKKCYDNTRDGVQIITLHSSKGLEFDIVFPLGLIRRGKLPLKQIPHPTTEGVKLVPIFDSDDNRYKAYCEEIDAEKMRQLYVAMTRAKYRIYCPVIFSPQSFDCKPATASPMELFQLKLCQSPKNYEEIYNDLLSLDEKPFEQFLKNNNDEFSFNYVEEIDLSKKENKSDVNLSEPKSVSIPGKNFLIQSFTSMSVKHRGKEILNAPANFQVNEKSVHTMPSGSETGILLHRIFEKVPISIFENINCPNDLKPFISNFTKETDYNDWTETICDIVYSTFHADLGNFSLSQVDQTRVSREIEFLYSNNDGLLKGVIDMFFEHGGRYYIVDWKTNWVGPTFDNYEQNGLSKVMEENNYYLQAKLYREAITRYLNIFDFDKLFGGTYYLFVRGMKPNLENGIYKI